MAETQVRFPQSTVTEWQAEEWLKDWSDIVREFGLKRFEFGLQQARLKCRFFPLPAEIREEAMQYKHPPIPVNRECVFCGGSGWRPDPEHADQQKLPKVVRCECRAQAKPV